MESIKCERDKKREELLTQAKQMPGVATLMSVLAQWQELDNVQKKVQLVKPQMTLVSAANTCKPSVDFGGNYA